LIYLAGPYSHPDEEVREARFRALTAKAADLMLGGQVVFSPITHGHTIAEYHDLPLDFEWWQHQCMTMLGHASRLIVLRLDGYAESIGVMAEVEYAEANSIPIGYVNP